MGRSTDTPEPLTATSTQSRSPQSACHALRTFGIIRADRHPIYWRLPSHWTFFLPTLSSYTDFTTSSSQEQKGKTVCTHVTVQTEVNGSFGLMLYNLRSRLNITQREAARRCSISRGYFSELENGKRPPPPLFRVERMGSAMNASTQELAFLCAAARSERLAHRNLPGSRRDLQELVQHLLLHGPSIEPRLVRELMSKAAAGTPTSMRGWHARTSEQFEPQDSSVRAKTPQA